MTSMRAYGKKGIICILHLCALHLSLRHLRWLQYTFAKGLSAYAHCHMFWQLQLLCICLFVVWVTLLKLSMLHWSVLGKLGLRQLGLGALLSGTQLSIFSGRTVGETDNLPLSQLSLSLSNCPWPNLLWACFFLAFLYFLYFFYICCAFHFIQKLVYGNAKSSHQKNLPLSPLPQKISPSLRICISKY